MKGRAKRNQGRKRWTFEGRNMISRLISKLFLLSEYSDHNNDGQWGNDTNGLSGVDAGAPAEGDCDGSWQHLEVLLRIQ